MKPLHWVIVVFWIFVGAMILKQCHDDNVRRDEEAAKAPQQFFFHQPPSPPAAPALAPAAPPSTDADVEQIGFVVHDDTPGQGSFTCDVTVKNVGQKKATGVQVSVRPFHGARYGNDNVGHAPVGILPDTDRRAQIENWLAFPDLAPGEQSTQSTVFLKQVGLDPGSNPNPEIDFKTVKEPSNP